MPEFGNIRVGLSATRNYVVDAGLTVSHLGTPVLGTPRMIGLMEIVCMDLVQPLLPPGYTTVGYEVQVRHKARAYLGVQVNVSVKLLEAEGRKLLFEVRVTEGEKPIGEGQRRRTVVAVNG